MGCGKTLQAIALLSCYLHEDPVLVVCPASLRPMWLQELDKWLDTHTSTGRGPVATVPVASVSAHPTCKIHQRLVELRGIFGQFDAWHDPRDRGTATATGNGPAASLLASSQGSCGVPPEARTIESSSITVISYEMLKRLPEMATDSRWRWGLVILDEAHEHMRTPTNQVTIILSFWSESFFC